MLTLMGKRSDFQRIEKDYYRTIDRRAVEVLQPHLEPQTRFIEPCAGAGDLIDRLTFYGHICVSASDVEPQRADVEQRDAFQPMSPFEAGEASHIITNPPWSRPILHRMILTFIVLKPTWLLFDADWMHTKQASPFMAHCRKIVSVGRLLWIPGTTMTGKDNCAWYLFTEDGNGATEFYPREAAKSHV